MRRRRGRLLGPVVRSLQWHDPSDSLRLPSLPVFQVASHGRPGRPRQWAVSMIRHRMIMDRPNRPGRPSRTPSPGHPGPAGVIPDTQSAAWPAGGSETRCRARPPHDHRALGLIQLRVGPGPDPSRLGLFRLGVGLGPGPDLTPHGPGHGTVSPSRPARAGACHDPSRGPAAEPHPSVRDGREAITRED